MKKVRWTMMSSNTDTMMIKDRPLRHSNGQVLNDYELFKVALKNIDEYEAIHKEPCKIDPNFIEFMREGIKYVDSGQGSMVDYKKRHVLKQLNYDLIISNTNKLNEKLERKGDFKPQLIKKEVGRSKK